MYGFLESGGKNSHIYTYCTSTHQLITYLPIHQIFILSPINIYIVGRFSNPLNGYIRGTEGEYVVNPQVFPPPEN
jgi:hypothetical protein